MKHLRKKIISALHPDTKEAKNKASKIKKRHYIRDIYRKNNKRIECMMPQERFDKLKSFANSIGFTPTAFIKKSAFACIDGEAIKTKRVELALQKAISLLLNISNNINQIARHTNIKKHTRHIDLKKVGENLLRLEEGIESILKHGN